ncbi:MAG: hypothetical protein JWL63_3229 [Rhodocyclales bacterium]|nr:hypothetical protein [Rhodocyclales bacterium]
MLLRDEILARGDLAELVASRADDAAIAAAISVDRKTIQDLWLNDMQLVGLLVGLDGSLAISDLILSKFDALAASSRSMRAVLERLTGDQGLNFGSARVRAQIEAIPIFTETEKSMLLGLALQDAPVSVSDVIRALEGLGAEP